MPGDWLKRMDSALGSHKARPRADGQAEPSKPPKAEAAPVPHVVPAHQPELTRSPPMVPPPPLEVPLPSPVDEVVADHAALNPQPGDAAAPTRRHGGQSLAPAPVVPPRHLESPERTAAAISASQLAFASWLAYKLELGAELRMVPRQWELVDYFGDGSWELRRFPFDSLQSIALQGDSSLPRLEVRIAPEGREVAEVLLVFAGARMEDRVMERACLLHTGGFDDLEPAYKAILPAFLSLFARCSRDGDFSLLCDWALENDKSADAGRD